MSVFKPAQNSDDCYASAADISLTEALVYMGNLSDISFQTGVRFVNLDIPKDSTILTAKVTFQAYEDKLAEICNIQIKGEAADDAATFSTIANFNGRTRTTAYVNWNAIPAWAVDTDYDSPSLIDIIQEIVNRAGWVSGNDLVLFFANNVSSSEAHRTTKSYESSTTLCARLTVTWTPPAAGDTGAFFQLFN